MVNLILIKYTISVIKICVIKMINSGEITSVNKILQEKKTVKDKNIKICVIKLINSGEITSANKILQGKKPVKDKNNNKIWQHIIQFNKIDIINNGISFVTSTQIKDSKKTWTGRKNQFEPRLLCKMDSSRSRPEIFKENNICIFSVKNGTYALIKENIYIPLNKYYSVPNIIHNTSNSLLLDIGDSETSMLDKLYYNDTLEHIIGEKIKYGPLLGGRHRCSFDTLISSNQIKITGSQYETDGCYETDNYVCIVEAKSVECDDFNIRQLYYPFREVYKKVGDKKKIICLFIYRDKKKFIHIHKFKWNNYEKMLDIVNIGYYQYCYN